MDRPNDGEDDGAAAEKIDEIKDFVPKRVLGDSFFRLLQNDQSDIVDHLRKRSINASYFKDPECVGCRANVISFRICFRKRVYLQDSRVWRIELNCSDGSAQSLQFTGQSALKRRYKSFFLMPYL